MKKFLLATLAVIGTWLAAHAVPSGTYQDSNGNTVLVTDSQRLYKLDRNGRVTSRWQICDEKYDGSFHLLVLDDYDNIINGTIPSTRNGWWQENGNIYLNLESHPRTYTYNH